MPAKAWEEADKKAFEEKIEIIATIIQEHQKSIASSSSEKVDSSSLRFLCLLQSIGIDVVHRYLALSPNDLAWRQKYPKLRDDLTVCLYVMYKTPK